MRSPRTPLIDVLLFLALFGMVPPTLADAQTAPPATPPATGEEPEADEVAAPSGPRPTLRATVRSADAPLDVRMDGRLDEAAWATGDSISNLITIEPDEGGTPAGRTVVRVLANRDELVFGVRCFEEADGIVAFSKARDIELDEEDNITIVLGPYGDRRSGYVFGVNPLGSRFEGLITAQGDDVNLSWNTVWEAATSRDESGWSAEIRIPIKSLSFSRGLESWEFNIERRVQRLQESSRWAGAKRDFEIFQLIQAGDLTGLPVFDLGLGLTVRPALVSEAKRAEAGESREYTTEISLDAIQRLGPNLNATLTVNTDFAETEADARQTNLTRFDILFPEKRTFFLEGADIFEFGLGTDLESASMLPFFSRRIGLFTPEGEDEGVEVPILAGGKLNGRVGGTSIGALAAATDRASAPVPDAEDFPVPPAEMGVVRLRQNVLSESSAGVIATYGDPLDRESWLAGADFTYRTSEFREDKNLAAGAWFVTMDRNDLEGDKSAYGGKLSYPNDILDLGLTVLRIGEGFDPSLGFVHRTGNVYDATAEYNIRPEGESMFRRIVFTGSYFLAQDVDGRLESYLGVATPLDFLLESGDRLTAFTEFSGENPSEPFDVFDSPEKTIEMAPGKYEWTRYGLQGILAPKRRVSGELILSTGDFYDGEMQSIEASLVLKPWSLLTLSGSLERNDARLPERVDPAEPHDFVQYLTSLRLEFNFTPNFQITTFAQYDNESRSLGSAPRLRWTYHPLGDLFVSFNHNMSRTVSGPDPERWRYENDQLLVKIQHALRW